MLPVVFSLLATLAAGPQFAGSRPGAQAPITVASLLGEMGDRDTFARLPAVSYKQLQASSHDRTQTDPSDYKTWHSNQDYEQFIRTEEHNGKTEWVVMEHEGPGAITRIWTPLLKEKDKMLIRFYFDGEEKPTIEEPLNDMMRGKNLFQPPFAFISWPDPGVTDGVGSDLYYPIPFEKSCKITLSEIPFYYCISYRSYLMGTPIQTFSQQAMLDAAPIADQVGAEISTPAKPTGEEIAHPIKLGLGSTVSVDLSKGHSAISSLTLDFKHKPDWQDLRSTVIEMKFDGERTVWCPIGDFFGCGVHDEAVWDRFRQVDNAGNMSCFWPMPYRNSAKIIFHNYGKKPEQFDLSTGEEPWVWDDRSLYFHATWRYQYPLATQPRSDWNYLEAYGQGIYVGDTLTVFNPSSAWYGEGDERVYQDGETLPSHMGTGTEDYYGFAWGMANHFSSAYVAEPERETPSRDNWMGYTTTSRIRALDAIPFEQSLKFDMEIWHWADCKVGYAAATFWYARPGATSNRVPMPEAASAKLPTWQNKIQGAIECETMKILAKSDDLTVSIQTAALTQGNWSNNQQLFLQCKKTGDSLDLELPANKAGRYRVILYATRSYDYGIMRFSINGQTAPQVDLWNAQPIASGPIDLGVFDLKQGRNVLHAEVVGTNPKSTGAHYYFGLDCVVLKTS